MVMINNCLYLISDKTDCKYKAFLPAFFLMGVYSHTHLLYV